VSVRPFMHVTDANANFDLFAIHVVATSFFGFVRPLVVRGTVDVPAECANLLWAHRRSPFRIAMQHVVQP
jgi:hypothetical protein